MPRRGVVVIGGGLGGLATGCLLAKEGMDVLVLESHRVPGGNLQSFPRDGRLIDTGMHYVGGLAPGQTTSQILKYLGVLERLDLRRMDDEGFERIRFPDGQEYVYPMGLDRFSDYMRARFPSDAVAIGRYVDLLRAMGELISPDVMRTGQFSPGGKSYVSQSIAGILSELTQNVRLQHLLAATNQLYGGERTRSSVYTHCMVNVSNILGAYSFAGSSQHFTDALVDRLRELGGELRTDARVTALHLDGRRIDYVLVNGQERVEAREVISAIHPATTYELLENNTVLRRINFSRVLNLRNTYGIYTLHILPQLGTVSFRSENLWCYLRDDVWDYGFGPGGRDLPSVMISMQPPRTGCHVEVLSAMVRMPWSMVEAWADSRPGRRPEAYKEFKSEMNARILAVVLEHLPELRGNVMRTYSSSPLTYRDFTHTPQGSAYGILKDCQNPIASHLAPQCKVENLYFTGQNLNVHGALGTLISAVVTSGLLVGMNSLVTRIGNA